MKFYKQKAVLKQIYAKMAVGPVSENGNFTT